MSASQGMFAMWSGVAGLVYVMYADNYCKKVRREQEQTILPRFLLAPSQML